MCKFADNGCQVGQDVFALINVVVVVVGGGGGSGGGGSLVVHVTKIVDA